MDEKLGLVEVIKSLREQVTKAIQQGEQETVKFEATEIEVELQTQIERGSEAEGKINFWIAELGIGGASKDINTHTLRFKLKPLVDEKPATFGRMVKKN